MATLTQSSLSLEYVRVPVSTSPAVDITSDDVELAFMPTPVPTGGTVEPEEDDWVTAEWETVGGTYYARALVGPDGGEVLADGSYVVWVRINDNPEYPVIEAGRLKIT